jgi:molybdate transport system substrate-binding protein
VRSRFVFGGVAAVVAASTVAAFVGAASATTPATRLEASNPTGSITVSAASSLTEVFTQLGREFQKRFKGTTVTFNFGSSTTLETQIQQGAPADVFASADTTNMDKLSAAGDVSDKPVVFAHNLLEIAVAKGNPKKIKTLADTLKPGVQLVLCAATVPCGKFALQAYQQAGLTVPRVPTGQDVKATLSNVSLGTADAAVVYVTDVKAAKGKVAGVVIPAAQNVVATYPIAVVKSSANAATASTFVKYVALSPAARATLLKFGFLKP